MRVNRNGRPHGLALHQLLEPAEPRENRQNDQRGGDTFEVVATPQRNTDRRYNPNRGGTRESHDRAAGVENSPCADESDAGDDLPRDASWIGACASRTRNRAE